MSWEVLASESVENGALDLVLDFFCNTRETNRPTAIDEVSIDGRILIAHGDSVHKGFVDHDEIESFSILIRKVANDLVNRSAATVTGNPVNSST